MCVCVCLCVCIYIYIYTYNRGLDFIVPDACGPIANSQKNLGKH